MNTIKELIQSAESGIPQKAPNIIDWAHDNVVLPGSARSRHFNIEITPWLREPLMRATDLETRFIDLRKPVQSGGSVFGEVLMLYWIVWSTGFFQYNWSNDKRANERWASRIHGILNACAPVRRLMERIGQIMKGEIDFGNVFFRNQGAFVSDNLDSDSIRLQLNEEVHSWEPGHLKKAHGRLTAVWDFKSCAISNAGRVGDQFDQSHSSGTNQIWMVKCPGCSNPNHEANAVYHVMRTRYDERKNQLGGLRYDADGARLGDYHYDYNKIRPTIRYQMPCGLTIHNEDISTRRKLSLGGVYSLPRNKGAELSHRSYSYEAVSVDYIDWMTLIKDKHDALRARSMGDEQPWIRYCQERENIPYNPDEVPITNFIEVKAGLVKNRAGLFGKKFRGFTLDRQEGSRAKGETPYWWLCIRDAQIYEGVTKSMLVWEGRVETDDQVIAILREHQCNMWQGCADSGDDTFHVYAFCFNHGIHCIKGGKEEFYAHPPNGARRIFSTERPLCQMINRDPKYAMIEVDDGRGGTVLMFDPREPMFWLYSKSGIRERFHFLRSNTDFITPEDVSDDYREHMDSEEREKYQNPTDGSWGHRWVQKKTRNDLFVCECYLAMLFDQAGLIHGRLENQKQ